MKSRSNKIELRHSIRVRLAVYTAMFILISLLSLMLLNIFLMEPYYVSDKVKILKEGMQKLDTLEDSDADELLESWQTFFESNNLTYAVANEENTKWISNAREEQGRMMLGRLFGYNTGIDQTETDIIEATGDYQIQKSPDFFSGDMYIEIWGSLSDGRGFIIRSPMASIQDSVELSNLFFARTGILVAIIAGIVVWLLTGRIIRPITELTEVSQKMTELDFQTKYTSGGKDEIGVLGRNFNLMSEELERAISELKSANLELQKDLEKKEQIDEMRKDFLSNVSHELKTPLALIQGYAEGLQDNINEDEESRQFYCEVIVDEAAKMNTMVKKLLTLNQLEFGNEQVELERFDLTALLKGVLEASRLVIEQKGVTVKMHQKEPLYVWGDEFKVEEIITNYISNALNHAAGEKILSIRCHSEDGIVKTSVFNTGEQIPEADIDKIWIKFYKVDRARTREYGGSGIGLSIVKAICDSLGQKCGVENYSNGVEFWFTLEHCREQENTCL